MSPLQCCLLLRPLSSGPPTPGYNFFCPPYGMFVKGGRGGGEGIFPILPFPPHSTAEFRDRQGNIHGQCIGGIFTNISRTVAWISFFLGGKIVHVGLCSLPFPCEFTLILYSIVHACVKLFILHFFYLSLSLMENIR